MTVWSLDLARAEGLAMARLNINSDAAHAYLVRMSQEDTVKLLDIAQDIVADHDRSAIVVQFR